MISTYYIEKASTRHNFLFRGDFTGAFAYRSSSVIVGIVKLIFTLVRLAPCVAYSPHEYTTSTQSLQAASVSCRHY
jgi:hypothetical protein